MFKKLLIITFFCAISFSLQAKNVWIIIHGTFANQTSKVIKRAAWWRPHCPFYKELDASSGKDDVVEYFEWCGSNSHEKRVSAARKLLNFIAKKVNPHDKINIVAHSHGANIALLAAQELAAQKSKLVFSRVYALGVPVSKHYQPTMTHIKKLYNIFSFGDFVQPVLNLFGRVFDAQENIYNIQIKINGKSPSHVDLHDPIIAHHLPTLHAILPNNSPYCISFFSEKPPLVTLDKTRERDLKIDAYFTAQLITSFAESKKRGHTKLADISQQTKDRLLRFWNRRTFNSQAMPDA